MSASRKIWQTGWRVTVGIILLIWILNAIFVREAQRVAELQGLSWASLAHREQWQMAWSQGPQELWKTLVLVPPTALGVSVALMGSTILLGVIRWRMVMKVHGLDLTFARATEISMVAHFFNSFLLGSTGGDLMKAYYAARETHHKKTEAVVTVFVDRLLGLWAMLIFGGFMMLFNLPMLTMHEHLRALTLIVLSMLIGCSLIVSLSFWGGVSKGWAGARGWIRNLPKGAWLERSIDSCRPFGKEPWFIGKALALSMILNAVCVFQVMVLGNGLNLTVSTASYFLIVPIVICISAIPITPSGLGVRENLYVLILADLAIGTNATSALSLSLLAYAGSLVWSLAGGIVYISLRESHHLHESELIGKEENRSLNG